MTLFAHFLALLPLLLLVALADAAPLRLNASGDPEVLLSTTNANELTLSVAPFQTGTKAYPAYAQILSARQSKFTQFESAFPATIDLSEEKLGKGFPRLWISIDWMRPNGSIVLRRTYFADETGFRHLPPRSISDLHAFDPAWLLEERQSPTGFSVFPFYLPADSIVSIEILNAEKHPVRKLLEEKRLPKGENRVRWDQRNDTGEKLPPGAYTARVIAHPRLRLKKLYSIAGETTNVPATSVSAPERRAGAFPTLLTPFTHIFDNRLWRIFPDGRKDGGNTLFSSELPPDGAAAVPKNAARYYLFRQYGRIFLVAIGKVSLLCEYTDKKLVPLAMFGSVDGYLQDTAYEQCPISAFSDKSGRQPDFFVWSDLNQDGFLQEPEVQCTPPDFMPACASSGWLVPGFAFQMPFRTPSGLCLLSFKPEKWTRDGIPVYNLETAVSSAQILPENNLSDANAPFSGGASIDDSGCLFFLGSHLYHTTGADMRLCDARHGSILGMATLKATQLPPTDSIFRQEYDQQTSFLNLVAVLQKPGNLVFYTDTGLRLDSQPAPVDDAILAGACFADARPPYEPAVLMTAEPAVYGLENSQSFVCIEIPCTNP